MFSLKEPQYQCFRERIGVAKLLEEFDQISAELKSLLMASENLPLLMDDVNRNNSSFKPPTGKPLG